MTELTLTRADRNAVLWIGHRYSHGDELYSLLMSCETSNPDAIWEWDDYETLTFLLAEEDIEKIQEIDAEDNFACFSKELIQKIRQTYPN